MELTLVVFLCIGIAMVTSGPVRDMTIFEDFKDNDVDLRIPGGIDDVDHWFGTTKVAFTAYLSENKDELGKGQHVKFDKVILNDGNGYKPHLGTFTAPVSGVYSFTVVIAQANRHEIRVKLVMDGTNEVDAIAEGMHHKMNVQGTNTVNLFLCKGNQSTLRRYHLAALKGTMAIFDIPHSAAIYFMQGIRMILIAFQYIFFYGVNINNFVIICWFPVNPISVLENTIV